ncbi:MAG: hypothetical protein JXM68_07215 [Sedimentisphaerales bacterium]|nr:hypothetical protein [Sedimentisphaerales bacterium]
MKKLTALVLATALGGIAMAETQEERIAALEKKVQEMESSKITGKTKGGYDIQFYGFGRLDAMWLDSNAQTTCGGAIFMWSKPETTVTDDDQLGVTARNTRLGMDLIGPSTATLKSSAKIELDFSGTGTETNNEPRIRHGYLQLDMPESNMSIIAGQTWDVIAPLNPPTVDCSILWWQGNVGMRRPQLRITKGMDLNDQTSFKLEGALARTVGTENNYNGVDSGSDSGLPSMQARVSMTTPVFNELKSTFGISGLYGQEEYDVAAGSTDSRNFNSWLMAFDMNLPITKETLILGEVYRGSNTGTYGGAIGQNLNLDKTLVAPFTLTDGDEIHSTGCWLALSQKLNDKFSVAGGYSLDTVDPEDLDDNSRQSNQTAFTNVVYKPMANVLTGVELAHNITEYQNSENGETLRASMFMQFNF